MTTLSIIDDMNNAHGIFCPYIAVARGKTVRQRPDRVMTDYVAVLMNSTDTNLIPLYMVTKNATL